MTDNVRTPQPDLILPERLVSSAASGLDHEARHDGIGGSEVFRLLTGHALEIYYNKTRPLPEDVDDESGVTTGQLRGRLLEPVFADMWARATDSRIRRLGQRVHPTEPWARVNIDRQVFATEEHPTGLLEVKAPEPFVYENILETGLRDSTALQIAWGQHVTGYDIGWYVAGNFHRTPPMVTFSIERDGLLITMLADMVKRFWTEHVLEREPPVEKEWEVLGQEAIAALPGPAVTRVVLSDEEIEHHAGSYCYARNLRKESEAIMLEHREPLEAMLDGADYDEVMVGRYKLSLKQGKPRSKLELEMLRQHAPIDRDAFVRWLRGVPAAKLALSEASIESIATQLGLDVDRFVTRNDPKPTFRALEKGD